MDHEKSLLPLVKEESRTPTIGANHDRPVLRPHCYVNEMVCLSNPRHKQTTQRTTTKATPATPATPAATPATTPATPATTPATPANTQNEDHNRRTTDTSKRVKRRLKNLYGLIQLHYH